MDSEVARDRALDAAEKLFYGRAYTASGWTTSAVRPGCR